MVQERVMLTVQELFNDEIRPGICTTRHLELQDFPKVHPGLNVQYAVHVALLRLPPLEKKLEQCYTAIQPFVHVADVLGEDDDAHRKDSERMRSIYLLCSAAFRHKYDSIKLNDTDSLDPFKYGGLTGDIIAGVIICGELDKHTSVLKTTYALSFLTSNAWSKTWTFGSPLACAVRPSSHDTISRLIRAEPQHKCLLAADALRAAVDVGDITIVHMLLEADKKRMHRGLAPAEHDRD
jgi:hypothetical protein